MANLNHPDDERLSALAARDDDAAADGALRQHIHDCDRCADTVTELGALRASLADLPDLVPVRPLRLLPPAAEPEPSAADRLGGWVRRFFAPVVAAGVALAMVGLVGTAAPAALPMSDGAGEQLDVSEAGAEPGAERAGDDSGNADVLSGDDGPAAAGDGGEVQDGDGAHDAWDGSRRLETTSTGDLPAERSPWPMVLFTGVALVIGALLLRWILIPRAG
jgi:hypothetical protein